MFLAIPCYWRAIVGEVGNRWMTGVQHGHFEQLPGHRMGFGEHHGTYLRREHIEVENCSTSPSMIGTHGPFSVSGGSFAPNVV